MKYEFTGEKAGSLKRIRALRDFGGVKAGELGGWIGSESNLSHSGSAWVSGSARVYGSARVFDRAEVSGRAEVYGSARVSGIRRSDGYCFCYVPDKEAVFHVIAGCRYFTMAEARKHWANTRGGTPLGDETMCILDAIEALHKVKPDGCV